MVLVTQRLSGKNMDAGYIVTLWRGVGAVEGPVVEVTKYLGPILRFMYLT